MNIPTKEESQMLLEKHVKDEYQRYHAKMVAQYGKDFTYSYRTILGH